MNKSMKTYTRPGLVLAAGLAATVLSSHLSSATPYASGISKSGATVNYVLNQDAAGLTVLTNGNVFLTEIAPVKGAKSFVLPDANLAFSIIVTGNTAKAWTQISSDALTQSKYYSPRGVYVDTNPKRSTFGRIIVAEAAGGATAGTPSRTTTDGLYILSADQGDVTGQGDASYAGGVNWALGTSSSPWKISMNSADPLGQDYTVYISDWSDSHSGIWTADALNPSAAFNELFNNTGRAASGIVLENGGAGPGTLHGSVASAPWVEGTGVDRKLFTVDEDYLLGNVFQYDIGTTTSGYATAPTSRVTDNGKISNGRADVVRDADGSWWIAQFRSTDTTGTPSLSRWLDGASSPSWNSGAAPVQLNNAYGCLDINNKVDQIVIGTTGGGGIYVIDISNPDSPVRSTTITGTGSGSIQDIAFDAAGNIYTVNNTVERLRIYSPGGYTICTTTSDGTFDMLTTDNVSVTATDAIASETGPDNTATFTVNRSGGPNGDILISYTMSGTAVSNVDYTISPTSPFNFPAGQSSIAITVTPDDDAQREPTETVTLTISAGGLVYSAVSPTSATATIQDNEASFVYWDINGADSGPGGFGAPGGNWADANWSTDSGGNIATGLWTDWTSPVFSAGSEAFLAFTVTNVGTRYVDKMMVEEGFVTIEGGTLVLTNFDGIDVALEQSLEVKSEIAGVSGLTKTGDGSLMLYGPNSYTGPTVVKAGLLKLGASEVILAGLSLDTATFDLNYFSETVSNLAATSGSIIKLFSGTTLTFGSDNSNTTMNASTPWASETGGGGTFIKLGTGTFTIGGTGDVGDALSVSNGMVSINSSARLGTGSTAPITLDNGAILRTTSSVGGTDFTPPTRAIAIGPGGATLRVNDATAIQMIHEPTAVISGGTLTKDGAGELRTYEVQHSFNKLYVKAGLYTAGHAALTPYATSFGAIPATFAADAITIGNGGSIRKAGGLNLALDPKQGITLLGTGDKGIRSFAGDVNSGTFEIPSVITGPGPLIIGNTLDALSIVVLSGNNTYTGNTALLAGRLFVNNTAGSGTGTGNVTVTNATLGGSGTIGGNVLMQGGALAAGYLYYTGDSPGTEMRMDAAKLTITNGLDLSRSSSNVWQLAALSEANPGVDFDQVELTGGSLVLGGSSALNIGFTGTATAPSGSEPFWTQPRQWLVVSRTGTAAVPTSNFGTITGTNGITAGTFTTVVDPTGILLKYQPNNVPQPITNVTVSISGGNINIGYADAVGSQFVLLQSADAGASMATWSRIETNTASSYTFSIPIGSDPKLFYRIKSE